MTSKKENDWIASKTAQWPVIPHVVRPYKRKFKLSYVEEKEIFESLTELENARENLKDLLSNYKKARRARKKSISHTRKKITRKLARIKLFGFVRKKIKKGWSKWRKRPQNFLDYLGIWCYRNQKSIVKAEKQYEEQKIIFSKDLTTGILRKEDLKAYTEKIGGKLEKIRITHDGSYYTDIKGRFKWKENIVNKEKKLFSIPNAYVIIVEQETGLLALTGKRIGIIIAPVKT